MLDSLQIPVVLACLSVVVQPLWTLSSEEKSHVSSDPDPESEARRDISIGLYKLKKAVQANGGSVSFALYTVRFAALIALVVLSRDSLGRGASGCLDRSAVYQAQCSKTLVGWTYVSLSTP